MTELGLKAFQIYHQHWLKVSNCIRRQEFLERFFEKRSRLSEWFLICESGQLPGNYLQLLQTISYLKWAEQVVGFCTSCQGGLYFTDMDCVGGINTNTWITVQCCKCFQSKTRFFTVEYEI